MWGSFEKRIVLLLLFSALCNGHTISLKLRYDKRHVIPLTNFQFSDHVGHLSFLISSVTVHSSSPSSSDPSRIGFILQPREVRNNTRFKLEENNTICALDFTLNSVLFTFQNLSHEDPNNNNNNNNNNNSNSLINKKSSFPVTYSGLKSLLFVNCNNESLVTMEGRAELYNMNGLTTKNYLSAGGLNELPFLSFIFSFLYLCFLGFWILVCLSNRQAFSRTHLLMGGLLVINFVYFICVAADLLYVKATGTAHGLDILFSVLQLIRALFFFTMVVLIGLGCFLWKPCLFVDEMVSLAVVILIQLRANVINPILPWEWELPVDLRSDSSIEATMLDFLCCLYVIFGPITWQVSSLQTVCEIDLNADRYLEKLSVFNMLLVVYMFITRVIVLLMSTQYYWVTYAVKETSTFVFHMAMFYIFRPVDRIKIKRARWNHESWLSTN